MYAMYENSKTKGFHGVLVIFFVCVTCHRREGGEEGGGTACTNKANRSQAMPSRTAAVGFALSQQWQS